MKLFAVTASTAFLLTLGCLNASPAGARHSQKVVKSHKPHSGDNPYKPHGGDNRGHYQRATTYEVNLVLPDGARARLSDVAVTAVDPSGKTAWVGMMPTDPDYDGYAYSGLELDLSGLCHAPAIEAGDRITIAGTVAYSAAGNRLIAAELSVTATGQELTPIEVSASSLVAVDSGPYDAALVRVPDLTLVDHSEPEWIMSGGLVLGNAIIGTLPPVYADGTTFESVTGIAATIDVSPTVEPRSVEDLHLGS